MSKKFIDANELLIDSFQLATTIYRQGFRPTFIIGVWRGGAPIGIAVQEFFEYMGQPSKHIAIRSSSYYGIEAQHQHIELHNMDYVIENISSNDQLLIVDDVFDSGRSLQAIKQYLIDHCKNKPPKTIKLACPWYKPTKNATKIAPDFYLHTTEKWLIFPHEISGLSITELQQYKPEIAELITATKPS